MSKASSLCVSVCQLLASGRHLVLKEEWKIHTTVVHGWPLLIWMFTAFLEEHPGIDAWTVIFIHCGITLMVSVLVIYKRPVAWEMQAK